MKQIINRILVYLLWDFLLYLMIGTAMITAIINVIISVVISGVLLESKTYPPTVTFSCLSPSAPLPIVNVIVAFLVMKGKEAYTVNVYTPGVAVGLTVIVNMDWLDFHSPEGQLGGIVTC